jgi:hypothetical protein
MPYIYISINVSCVASMMYIHYPEYQFTPTLLSCPYLIKLASNFAVQFLQSPRKFLKLSRYLPTEKL